MIWHINDHTRGLLMLLAKQQYSLEHQGRLVVQQVLPPVRWDNLWQDIDRHATLWLTLVSFFEVRQERTHHRTIGRFQHHQRHVEPPGMPALSETFCRCRIDIDHDSR